MCSRPIYNLQEAKNAIGSGGLFGSGIGHGAQTNLGYVPEQQTDFIFTAVGEQLGFVGAVGVLVPPGTVAWRVLHAAAGARDTFGRLLCAGLFTFLAFSVFQNAGMTMGIMPITGIPLAVPQLWRDRRARLLRRRGPGAERGGAAAGQVTEGMSAGPSPAIFRVMRVEQVSLDLPAQYPVVTLVETEPAGRVLVFPIGLPEGTAMAQALRRLGGQRPMTHELFAQVLRRTGVEVASVRLVGREGGNLLAVLELMTSDGRELVDCRPSDGIVLALRSPAPAPILVDERLLEERDGNDVRPLDPATAAADGQEKLRSPETRPE